MKTKPSIILAALVLVLVASSAAAQNVCTKQVDDTAVKLYIRNATAKAFTVHYKESPSDEKIEPERIGLKSCSMARPC